MNRIILTACLLAAFAGVAAFAQEALKLLPISDEFNDAKSLKNWKVFSETEHWPNRIEKTDVNKTLAGHLYLEPKFGGWWNGFHGALLYREIQGDFVVVTRLLVKGKKESLPTVVWNRGGILVRKPGDLSIDPKDRVENLVHIMTGVNGGKAFTVYSGNIRDSRYDWSQHPNSAQKESRYVELGIFRAGEVFIAFYRYETPEWKILRKDVRPDLAGITLQAGLTACAEPFGADGKWLNATYSNYDYNKEVLPSVQPVDVRVYVDYFRAFQLTLSDEDKANFAGNKLSLQEYVDKLNELVKLE
jgi:hypothetical protein